MFMFVHLRWPRFIVYLVVVCPGFSFVFSILLAKRLAGKSIPKMTYFVLIGALNLNSVN